VPHSTTLQQVENGVAVRMAVFAALVSFDQAGFAGNSSLNTHFAFAW